MVAEYQELCYQISIVLVKENLEVVEREEDSSGTADRWSGRAVFRGSAEESIAGQFPITRLIGTLTRSPSCA